MLDETVSLRRVALALRGLPMGVWADPEHVASWSVGDHLLANLCDVIRELTWVTVAANSKHVPKRPEPVYRPGARPARPRGSWSDLAGQVAGAGGAPVPRKPIDIRGLATLDG